MVGIFDKGTTFFWNYQLFFVLLYSFFSMNENLDPTNTRFSNAEKEVERALRPLNFSDFRGQTQVLDNLQVFVLAAKQRGEALDHVLLHGPPGLGKTTLSHIITNELDVGIKTT